MWGFLKFAVKLIILFGCVAIAVAWYQGRNMHHYTIAGEEAYDSKSDLTWKRCSVGQSMNDSRCTGNIRLFSFEQAQQLGDGNWRVPTRDELITLVDHVREDKNLNPTIDVNAFPDMSLNDTMYWTSTDAPPAMAFAVKFSAGDLGNGSGGHKALGISNYPVRMVRSGH